MSSTPCCSVREREAGVDLFCSDSEVAAHRVGRARSQGPTQPADGAFSSVLISVLPRSIPRRVTRPPRDRTAPGLPRRGTVTEADTDPEWDASSSISRLWPAKVRSGLQRASVREAGN